MPIARPQAGAPSPGLQRRGDALGLDDTGHADQHRLPAAVGVLDLLDDGRQSVSLRRMVDPFIDAARGPMRGNRQHGQSIDFAIFFRILDSGAGHAGQRIIFAKERLEGDGCQRARLLADRAILLGLQRLVQAVIVATTFHQAAGQLIDNDDAAVLDDIVPVANQNRARNRCLDDVVQQADGLRDMQRQVTLQQACLLEPVIDPVVTVFGQRDAAPSVELEIACGQPRDLRVDGPVEAGMIAERPEQCEGHRRLVDQHRVRLVDQRETAAALHGLCDGVFHVVAEVVKTELAGHAIGDVAGIGVPPAVVVHLRGDQSDAETERFVDRSHPGCVARAQIVVRRRDVHAAPGHGPQRAGQRRGQGLALAGRQLGDVAVVHGEAGYELCRHVQFAERAPAGFAHQRKGGHDDGVEGGAIGDVLAQGPRAVAQGCGRQRAVCGLLAKDSIGHVLIATQRPLGSGRKRALGETKDHLCSGDAPSVRSRRTGARRATIVEGAASRVKRKVKYEIYNRSKSTAMRRCIVRPASPQ